MTLESSVIVTPLQAVSKELDCDFGGDLVPKAIVAVVVTVYPKTKVKLTLNEYNFIVILPEMEGFEEIVLKVVEPLINYGDQYKFIELTDEMAQSYDRSTPVISFDPRLVENGVLSIFWLIPPKTAMS